MEKQNILGEQLWNQYRRAIISPEEYAQRLAEHAPDSDRATLWALGTETPDDVLERLGILPFATK